MLLRDALSTVTRVRRVSYFSSWHPARSRAINSGTKRVRGLSRVLIHVVCQRIDAFIGLNDTTPNIGGIWTVEEKADGLLLIHSLKTRSTGKARSRVTITSNLSSPWLVWNLLSGESWHISRNDRIKNALICLWDTLLVSWTRITTRAASSLLFARFTSAINDRCIGHSRFRRVIFRYYTVKRC